MFIIKYKNLFLGFTVALLVFCGAIIFKKGLVSGIDFTGGSILEGEYPLGRPDVSEIKAQAEEAGITPAIVQETGSNGILVRTRSLSESERQSLVAVLSDVSIASSSVISATGTKPVAFVETSFNSVGPVIGQELRTRSFWAIAMVILLIVLYITFVFRQVSRPIASWKYGLIAIVTLVHDIIVPSAFAAYQGIEVDVLFVTAILAVLGFSIHDTIVVFDRIRENLRGAGKKESFSDVVGRSVSETFARSINTSLTTVLGLIVLYFVGGESTHAFSLVLITGIVAGAYSSIFFASPLLVLIYDWQEKGKK